MIDDVNFILIIFKKYILLTKFFKKFNIKKELVKKRIYLKTTTRAVNFISSFLSRCSEFIIYFLFEKINKILKLII